jgi:hypothetical protein
MFLFVKKRIVHEIIIFNIFKQDSRSSGLAAKAEAASPARRQPRTSLSATISPMFAARPFPLNPAASTPVAAGARASSTKTTTIKG